MSEGKKRPESQSLTTNDFKPFAIFKDQSSEYNRLPKHTRLIEDHFDNAAQPEMGFTFHEIFVSKTKSADWVFAVIVQWQAEDVKPITKRTSFSVDLEATHVKKESLQFCGHFTDVPLVDAVESNFDGKQVIVGMLCIPAVVRMVEVQAMSSPWGKCFEDLRENIKVGFRLTRGKEVKDADMPFNYIDIDLDKDYVFAMEYGLKKTCENNYLVQVKTLDPYSPDKALALFPETFIHHNTSEVFLLIWVAHWNNERLPMTTETPFTINLRIRWGPEENKPQMKPYHKEISVKPTIIEVVEEFNYGLLNVSLPVNSEEEVRFFEEAFKDERSIDVTYEVTRHR
ncbi:hypothetical protein EIK77_001004 [Talaromyces pinophilus]|nr:hypothetical protein EIK77_001004 [Talaromyces pinophilus]PCG98003.1 hypothetical protein PENOC_065260 [Penicillium occitanis (nom. inval.)]PCH03168.1 Hypothetical protein PENO1_034200 [Penicillium occitanis (nom. inval.)]